MTEENHLFEGTIANYNIFIDEQRNESFSESEGQVTYTKNYHLQTEEPVTISVAKSLFILWLKLAGRRRMFGYPISNCNVTHADENDLDVLWNCEVTYTGKSDEEEDYTKYQTPYTLNESFNTSGGTSHITDCQWISDGQNSYEPGETVYQCNQSSPGPSTFNGRIGYNGETCDGCDIVTPSFSFQLHKKLTADEMTSAYRQTLARLTGCVNDDEYCGFTAGNLLLEGVSGTSSAEYREEDVQIDPVTGDVTWLPYITYDLTFSFKGGFEFTNFNVSGATVASKKSFQYMWVYSIKTDDTTVGTTIEEPKCVIVNDVYPSGDFTLLNIYGEQDE